MCVRNIVRFHREWWHERPSDGEDLFCAVSVDVEQKKSERISWICFHYDSWKPKQKGSSGVWFCHLNPRNSTSSLLWMWRIVEVFVLRLFAFSMKALCWNWSTLRLGFAEEQLWKTAKTVHSGVYYPPPEIWRWFSDNFIFAQWIIENKNCQFFTHKICHLMRSISGRQHSTIKKVVLCVAT